VAKVLGNDDGLLLVKPPPLYGCRRGALCLRFFLPVFSCDENQVCPSLPAECYLFHSIITQAAFVIAQECIPHTVFLVKTLILDRYI